MDGSGPNSETAGWRELVTDGHVIAARLRWLQPWFLAASCAAMLIGFVVAWETRPAPDYGGAATTRDSVVMSVRAPATDTVNHMPALAVPADKVGFQSLAEEVIRVEKLILESLQTSGSLPDSQLALHRVGTASFWQKPWPYSAADHQVEPIDVVDLPTLKLVGVVVQLSKEDGGGVEAFRWLGVFSKRNGQWRFASLQGAGLITITSLPVVTPADIPLTLSPALPPRARHG